MCRSQRRLVILYSSDQFHYFLQTYHFACVHFIQLASPHPVQNKVYMTGKFHKVAEFELSVQLDYTTSSPGPSLTFQCCMLKRGPGDEAKITLYNIYSPLHAVLWFTRVELSPSHDDGAQVTLVNAHWRHQHCPLTAGETTYNVTWRRQDGGGKMEETTVIALN